MKAEDFDAARSFIAVEEETQRWSKWVASKKHAKVLQHPLSLVWTYKMRMRVGYGAWISPLERQISFFHPLESTKLGSAGMCLGNTPNGLAACSTFGKK
ncbi:hypothetical protein ANCDUO_17861, partial [Ancylostoma duodenale]